MTNEELIEEIIHLGFDLQESDEIDDMNPEWLKQVKQLLEHMRDNPSGWYEVGII